MVKGFTPLIGLAVVVALALAAVFGSMSLAPSPAQAQAAVRHVSYVLHAQRNWFYTRPGSSLGRKPRFMTLGECFGGSQCHRCRYWRQVQ